jgi:GT2 family glycosyltransferase
MAAAAPLALPPNLDLTLVSRRPARLPDQTARAVLCGVPPVGLRSQLPGPWGATIAIVSFNSLVFTRMCLASVLANTFGPKYEVIVVDNASDDGTVEYLYALATANPHVRLILNDTNRGFAAANNQALAQAQGDVLVLLNNDTIAPPGWLEGLLRHLEDPAVGLVGPVTNRIGNEAEIEADYTTYGQLLDFARHNRCQNQGRLFDIPFPRMFCLAMRRDTFARLGPLDERFEVGLFEDDDYALRARAAGYRTVCAEDVFVHHFGQASFGSLIPTGEYERLLQANKQRLEAKWGRPWQPPVRRPSSSYEALKERIRRAVAEAAPPAATLVIVSRGDEDLLDLLRADGRTAWHFPQAADGSYAGFYPADSQAAIAHVEALRARGGEFLVIPCTALWWLDHYAELAQHLQRSAREVLRQDETCLIYALHDDNVHHD